VQRTSIKTSLITFYLSVNVFLIPQAKNDFIII